MEFGHIAALCLNPSPSGQRLSRANVPLKNVIAMFEALKEVNGAK